MTIDPKDAPADQPFKVAVGGRGYTAQRVDPKDDSEQWRLLVPVPSYVSPWKDDEQVSIIAPLVPARNVTRDDLPSMDELWERAKKENPWLPVLPPRLVLDAVVAHLNERGGIPDSFNLSAENLNAGGDVQPKSCCEEAQLTAKRADRAELELARRNEELAEAEGEIAELAQKNRTLAAERNTLQRCTDSWRVRAEKAEAERDDWKAGAEAESWAHDKTLEEARRFHVERDEARGSRDYWIDLYGELRDELQAKLDDPYSEVNQKAAAWDRVERHPLIGPLSSLPDGDSYAKRVCKRLDELAEMEAAVTELKPAENRPTLDREAVREVVGKHRGALGGYYMNLLVNDLVSLAPAAEGWPEWLGPRPVLRVPVRKADGNWTFHDGNVAISGDVREETCRDVIKGRLAEAVTWAGVLSAIESEQAATGEEDQRVEEVAEQAAGALVETILNFFNVEDDDGAARATARAIVREARDAGWTPPESEGA